MTRKEALEKSIEKWERIVDGDLEFGADCALCELYFDSGCEGCPVGYPWCDSTPHTEVRNIINGTSELDWMYTLNKVKRVDPDNAIILEKLAKEEVKFLKSLRRK